MKITEWVYQFILSQTQLSPVALKWIGVALLLLFLLYAVRQPGRFLKLVVVIALFVALGYAAYDVVQLGVERGHQLEKTQPGFINE
ncbi:MAG: hypothetical protein HY282_00655 [Nitrospirae bacterium]|nr:hypothetical protein [Candidatus Manganitrophaceae bacterium]